MVPIFKMIQNLRRPVALLPRKYRYMSRYFVQEVYGKQFSGVNPYGSSLVWFLVLILIRAILEQSINNKMVSKI